MRMFTFFSAVSCLLGWFAVAHADYKKDIGYTVLSSEVGAHMPDGTGVHVTHVEALSDATWRPNTADSEFADKNFYEKSNGHPDGYSGHATSVGRRFYGNAVSMTPGITEIDIYVTDNSNQALPPWPWLGKAFLWLGTPYQPLYDMPEFPNCVSDYRASPSRVANHSWVGSSAPMQESGILRRLDWIIDTDEYIQTVANCPSNSPLLCSAYNVIAVGRTSGESGTGSEGVDSVYTAGRPRPNVVAPVSSLSAAAPIVASACALLVQVGRNPLLSTDPVEQFTANRRGETIWNAERSEVIKAALMAGADRFTLNTSTPANIVDYRSPGYQTENGLDSRFGAGQINIYNSYQIIAAGEQNSDETGSGMIHSQGFDFDPSFGVVGGTPQTASYYFTCDEAHCNLSASLVWNLKIDSGTCENFDGAAMLYNLDLFLYDVTNAEAPQLVGHSTTDHDNTENLWVALKKERVYQIQVIAVGEGQDFNWDYALAWHVRRENTCIGDFDTDEDVDGLDLAFFAGRENETPLADMAAQFSRTDCLTQE